MSITADPVAAVLDAMVAYLDTELDGVCTVIRGWPEDDTAADIATLPVLSVEEVPGGVADEPASPSILGGVSSGTVVVAQGLLTITLQMDLFCAYRGTLDEVTALVDAALHNALPYRPHLYLTATGYDGAPFTVIRSASQSQHDGDTAQRGEWRRIWTLRAELDRRAPATMAELTTLTTTSTYS